jgi:uncharacterized protein YcfJ
MHRSLQALAVVAGVAAATHAAAGITLYEGENFHGRAFTATNQVRSLDPTGFNDRAASVIVDRGRWEVCEHANFAGRCLLLRRGNYYTLRDIGMENRISSVRPVGRKSAAYDAPPPPPQPVYEWRQRPGERLYEVPVESVRAVVGPPEQRCWVEREYVSQPNVPGAIVGGIIGGVLGHQIGSGHGQDVATAIGAVGGAAIGANVRGGGYTRDVQRCASAPPGPPQYWDVSYNFRGQWHTVQMSAPPGPTIWVNGRGEPRG